MMPCSSLPHAASPKQLLRLRPCSAANLAAVVQDLQAHRGGRAEGVGFRHRDPRQPGLGRRRWWHKQRLERRDVQWGLAYGGGPLRKQLRNRRPGCERLCGRGLGQRCSDACASLWLGTRPTNGLPWARVGPEQRPERRDITWQLARARGPPCEWLCGCRPACEWFCAGGLWLWTGHDCNRLLCWRRQRCIESGGCMLRHWWWGRRRRGGWRARRWRWRGGQAWNPGRDPPCGRRRGHCLAWVSLRACSSCGLWCWWGRRCCLRCRCRLWRCWCRLWRCWCRLWCWWGRCCVATCTSPCRRRHSSVATHLQLQLAHKVPDHVDGCAAMQALERFRKEADSVTVWRPQQQLHERSLAHFSLCV